MVDMIEDQVARKLPLGPVALHPVRNDRSFRNDPTGASTGLIGSGSSLLALNIAEEIADASSDNVILAPDLDAMRESRVRSVILIDDLIGSGRSVIDCVRLWREHPTVRSWHSYKLIRFQLVAFASTTLGLKSLTSSRQVADRDLRIHTQSCDFASADWTENERAEIQRICLAYSNNPKNPYGYGGAGGLDRLRSLCTQ